MAFLQSNLDRFNAIFFSIEYIIDTHYRQFIGRLAVNDEHQSHIAVRRLYGERQDEMVTCYAIKCVVVNPRHAGIQELRLNLEEREKLPFLCGNGLHRRLLEFFQRTPPMTERLQVNFPSGRGRFTASVHRIVRPSFRIRRCGRNPSVRFMKLRSIFTIDRTYEPVTTPIELYAAMPFGGLRYPVQLYRQYRLKYLCLFDFVCSQSVLKPR